MTTRQRTLYGIFIALISVKAFFFSNDMKAQTAHGIYLTAADFSAGRFYNPDINGHSCKIKIHEMSFHTPVKITCGDSVIHLSKDSVYGYTDKGNISHRFYNKNSYEIINPKETILLYKIMVSGKTKYEEALYNYFFSANVSSAVLPLTIDNLEKSFRGNTTFIDFLEVHFKNDTELLEYDENHKMYKLNHLLELSKIQK